MSDHERHQADLREQCHVAAYKAKAYQGFADACLHTGDVDSFERWEARAGRMRASAARIAALLDLVA